MLDLKTELFDKVSQNEAEHLKHEEALKALISKLQIDDLEHCSRLDNNKVNLTQLQGDVKRLLKDHEGLRYQTDNLQEQKMNTIEFNTLRENVRNDINRIKLSLEATNIKLRETESYLALYRPLQEFNQVVSLLNHVICDKKERLRLADYVK